MFLTLVLGACVSSAPPSRPLEGGASAPEAVDVPSAAEVPAPEAARTLLAAAEELVSGGRLQEAEAILRGLAAVDPATGIPARALLLRSRAALGLGGVSAALFYLKQALSSDPPEDVRYDINLAIGDLRFDQGDPEDAFRFYLEAVNRVPRGRSPAVRVWLRLAQIAHYSYNDRDLARYYLLKAPGLKDSSDERELIRRLSRRVSWQDLPPGSLGMADGNVSAVAADGNDLWVGTWNGGIVRYTLGSGQVTVFREGRDSLTANTVRSIEITRTRVWVGTYQGLFVYSKPSSAWSEVPEFGGGSPKRTEAIRAVGEDVYVGTLGDGLWRLRRGQWERVRDGQLPGEFINSLAYVDSWLLVGTLNLGIVLVNLESGALLSFDRVNPDLQARNVIMLLPVGTADVWIGTYGEGLYRWNRPENRLWHFDKAGGDLGDDWILCGTLAATGLYFGTFGAGVSRRQGDEWQAIGLRQGLAGLDVSAVAYAPPYLVFGTLGAGLTLFDETLALAGFPAIQ